MLSIGEWISIFRFLYYGCLDVSENYNMVSLSYFIRGWVKIASYRSLSMVWYYCNKFGN